MQPVLAAEADTELVAHFDGLMARKLVEDGLVTVNGAVRKSSTRLREGEAGWEQKLIDALPHLYMISICGADGGNTKEMGWDQLIQPLGEGSFDVYPLVKLARDQGYEGPFGLQTYNIKQDAKTALTTSITTWRKYRERYEDE